MRGSYCDESDQDLAPGRAGCARIKGYIAAGERFGSNDRIGGRLSLGPRILRADTAAVAALALIQTTLGDWPKGRTGDGL